MNLESPCVSRLLGVLTDHDVDFVLAGSVAVEAWGVDVGIPGDLDIIPAMDHLNLNKLANALHALEAEAFPVTGEWEHTEDGFVWREFAESDPRRHSDPQPPEPSQPASFDSLFHTRYGALDIVPAISGRYPDVSPRSSVFTVHGIPNVRVLGIADLLALITVPRRAKDASRVSQLRALQLGGENRAP